MQYKLFVFISFKKLSSPPELATVSDLSFEEAQEELEKYVANAELVEAPHFTVKIFEANPQCKNNRVVYAVSHNSKLEKAV